MPILNPDHLLEQAAQLATPTSVGRPRQVDVRRAISSAYYAAFHAIITAAADEVVGIGQRSTREHSLVMRSIDHKTIKTGCTEIVKLTPTKPYRDYMPSGGFGPPVVAIANLFPDLQDQRLAADYDSLRRYVAGDATSVIATARSVVTQLDLAGATDRRAFLYLLLFPPRR